MTELQILQLLGLIFVASGIGVLVSRAYTAALIEDLADHPAGMFVLGVGMSIVGFLLVSFHSNWDGAWTSVIITVTGWVSLIKGLASLMAAPWMHGMFGWVLRHRWLLTVGALIWIAAGGMMAAAGFGWM